MQTNETVPIIIRASIIRSIQRTLGDQRCLLNVRNVINKSGCVLFFMSGFVKTATRYKVAMTHNPLLYSK